MTDPKKSHEMEKELERSRQPGQQEKAGTPYPGSQEGRTGDGAGTQRREGQKKFQEVE